MAAVSSMLKPKGLKGSRRKASPYLHGDDNGRVVLTCQDRRIDTIKTADPFDRAHTVRNVRGEFFPSAFTRPDGTSGVDRTVASTPRRYPSSSMTSRGVAHDSMYDEWHTARLALAREGIALGGRSISGATADAMGVLSRLGDNIRLRDVLHKRTRQSGRTAEEKELSRQANELLAKAR